MQFIDIFDYFLYNCPLFTFFAIFFLWKLLLLYVICVIFDDFLHNCPLLPVFCNYFLFFSLKIINVKCYSCYFWRLFCKIDSCYPFFAIIFSFFLWKVLLLYVICVIFDDFLHNCPLLPLLVCFCGGFFYTKVTIILNFLLKFRCGGGPILGEFLFSVKDGTLLDKF